jgi:retron-type reverse transcriptase
MLKFMRVVSCSKISRLLNNMLSNHYFQVFLGDKRRLNNGLPQGSVLAPILFNLYMSGIPITVSKQFQYANEIALTFQTNSFAECETTLEADLDKLDEFLRRWRLQPNPRKTESCVFHLNTHEVNRQLDVRFSGTEIQHVGTSQIPLCNLRSYIDVQRLSD